jgi:hypothetical protein
MEQVPDQQMSWPLRSRAGKGQKSSITTWGPTEQNRQCLSARRRNAGIMLTI